MWKRIPYGSSSFQVFIKKCWNYLFLPIRFHFFMITLFSPFVRLRPVQAGFCVSRQTLIFPSYWKRFNILFGAFLVIYMSNKFPNPSRKMRLEELVWWISFYSPFVGLTEKLCPFIFKKHDFFPFWEIGNLWNYTLTLWNFIFLFFGFLFFDFLCIKKDAERNFMKFGGGMTSRSLF